ncbi:MAG: Glycogen accumulation regulator GarA [Chlamydiae bacterium]|nr:Glycogen accumulation regulator GarA [Chlamydiota bacterium]
MNSYLIAEEGPLAGMTVAFEEGAEEKNEWTLGRDPDTADIVLEDPMVSRRHVTIRLTPEGFILENLSSVNPATQNGMMVAEPVLLKEGDIIQIGSTFFHFTEQEPEETPAAEEEAPPESEEMPSEALEGAPPAPAEVPSELHFGPAPDTRWLLKVISGPNAGAEFSMVKGVTYLLGKDPNICDIVFQDLSVSRQHARLFVDEDENVFVEDLGSRNGVIVNGELLSEKALLSSQDLIALGTTTFLVVDRTEARETIISPPTAMPRVPTAGAAPGAAAKKKDWRELIIPKKHLALAGVFATLVLAGIAATFSLFQTEPIVVTVIDESGKIAEVIDKFPDVQFSFNNSSGKLFLMGHVLTSVDKKELLYLIKQMPFVSNIQDTVVVDEFVWQNMNALIQTNPDWMGISLYASQPGKFVVRGYLQSNEELEQLNDYINFNFSYLDRLTTEVVVEQNLQAEIERVLFASGLMSITFKLSNGEVVFTGRVDEKENKRLQKMIEDFKKVPGVRVVKDFVMVTSADTSRINLTSKFPVTGYSKGDDSDFFVVIGGRILGEGDTLDGMAITKIGDRSVYLEKEGFKFQINYKPE